MASKNRIKIEFHKFMLFMEQLHRKTLYFFFISNKQLAQIRIVNHQFIAPGKVTQP